MDVEPEAQCARAALHGDRQRQPLGPCGDVRVVEAHVDAPVGLIPTAAAQRGEVATHVDRGGDLRRRRAFETEAVPPETPFEAQADLVEQELRRVAEIVVPGDERVLDDDFALVQQPGTESRARLRRPADRIRCPRRRCDRRCPCGSTCAAGRCAGCEGAPRRRGATSRKPRPRPPRGRSAAAQRRRRGHAPAGRARRRPDSSRPSWWRCRRSRPDARARGQAAPRRLRDANRGAAGRRSARPASRGRTGSPAPRAHSGPLAAAVPRASASREMKWQRPRKA